MHDFIVEPKSRWDIRKIVNSFRKFLDIQNAEYVDVVMLLDILSKRIKGFSYEIVPNNTFSKKIFGTTDVKTGHIRIKQRIYNAACDGDGFARYTIAHEIGHFILLCVCGLQLAKAAKGARVEKFRDPEWQADCFAGEFLMGYDVVRNYSVKELMNKCVVTEKAARCQYDKFRK